MKQNLNTQIVKISRNCAPLRGMVLYLHALVPLPPLPSYRYSEKGQTKPSFLISLSRGSYSYHELVIATNEAEAQENYVGLTYFTSRNLVSIGVTLYTNTN